MMYKKLTALVTGASSGIGLELARLFAHDGYNLVLVARSQDRLKVVADELGKENNVQVNCLAKDLSVSSSPDEIYQYIKNEMLEINVLVNNAGYGWYGEFSRMEPSDILGMIQVNISSLTHLTRLVLEGMLHKNEGKILNVASTAGFQPGPLMAVYYASKAYVLNFSQALSEELRSTNISVSTLCPGPTPTNFGRRAGFNDKKILGGILSTHPKAVALSGYKGLMKGKSVIVPGKLNWLSTQFVRLVPRSVPGKIIKLAQQKRGN
jgi:short-subunit dehydrogenase